jgi:leucyl aminopeptidase
VHQLLPPDHPAIPVRYVAPADFQHVRDGLSERDAAVLKACDFDPAGGKPLILHGQDGQIVQVLVPLGKTLPPDPFLPGTLASALPAGDYRLVDWPGDAYLATLAVLIGSYRFTRYGKKELFLLRFVAPPGIDAAAVEREAQAVAFGRDLINTPANDLGPHEIEQAARDLAAQFGATVSSIVGDDLLVQNFPLIHAVGRASSRPPRLVDISWGNPADPKVTLVGKGVAFDTGGLDIKTSSSMLLMKKDMGGAASAMVAAMLVMGAGLPVRLRVLLPIVENAISGSSFRSSDVYPSRKGLTVEIGNTDAEGRLILCDALTLADEDSPELLIDFATLTGAARVALGPDLPPFMTDDDRLAADIAALGATINDPVWRLPLWKPYRSMLDSKLADINNTGSSSFAGAIVAGLYLSRFVEKARSWVHFDLYGKAGASGGRGGAGSQARGGVDCQALSAWCLIFASPALISSLSPSQSTS